MLALVLAMSLPQIPNPEPGIPKSLARARAAVVRDLHYDLAFVVVPPVAQVRGQATITFTLAEAWHGAPLVLDFGGQAAADLQVNGSATPVVAQADHLLLPDALLRRGENTVTMAFASAVAPTGTPLSVYRDAADGREYCYTLLVPADAHRLFPCFDQPDLKARFRLRLELPADWTAIANGQVTANAADGDRRRWEFVETAPLPTYLFAFAAGPFAAIEAAAPAAPGVASDQRLRILFRESQRPHLDTAELLRLHDTGLRWLCDWFAVEYPFGKLDLALIPGFPYGGMEHAGAIFYREQALVFDHPPTDGELVRRSTLVYHELSHQWFGNLVTMRWFDDLWLKEGFATFVAYRALEALEPERRAWLRFMQRVKPRAYEVDGTPGTTPVFQELQNLADAKSAYGAIVYNKAPAVLRELDARLGPEQFRAGLTQFLRRHAFGNATWQDLSAALEGTAKVDLQRWSERWLLAPSLPRVRVRWQADERDIVTDAVLEQTAVGGDGTWPLRVELRVAMADGSWRRHAVQCDAASAPIPALEGLAGVRCVVANAGDVAYAQFLPDAASRAWIAEHATTTDDLLLRAVMVAAMFEAVREAELAPVDFCRLAVALVEREADADTHAWLLDQLATCFARWMSPATAAHWQARLANVLHGQLRNDGVDARRLPTFRWLARHDQGLDTLALCQAVVAAAPEWQGLRAGREDKFLALTHLLANVPGKAATAPAVSNVPGTSAPGGGPTPPDTPGLAEAPGSPEVPKSPGAAGVPSTPGARNPPRTSSATAATAADSAGAGATRAHVDELAAALVVACQGQDIARELFLAHAARADAATKARYFDLYLQQGEPPEQWVQDSLANFHFRGQAELTFPYLRRALDQAQWVKANRRIFFMPAWLDAFVNAHSSPAALAVVDAFLADQQLDDDVRRKLQQSRDGLARAVRIRGAYP